MPHCPGVGADVEAEADDAPGDIVGSTAGAIDGIAVGEALAIDGFAVGESLAIDGFAVGDMVAAEGESVAVERLGEERRRRRGCWGVRSQTP